MSKKYYQYTLATLEHIWACLAASGNVNPSLGLAAPCITGIGQGIDTTLLFEPSPTLVTSTCCLANRIPNFTKLCTPRRHTSLLCATQPPALADRSDEI